MSDLTERAKALLANITPGPWCTRSEEVVRFVGGRAERIAVVRQWDPAQGTVDAEFIAAAPTLVADLLAELERRDRRDAFIAHAVWQADAAVVIQDVLPEGWRVRLMGDQIDADPSGANPFEDIGGFTLTPLSAGNWYWATSGKNGTADSPPAAAVAALAALGLPAPTEATS